MYFFLRVIGNFNVKVKLYLINFNFYKDMKVILVYVIVKLNGM